MKKSANGKDSVSASESNNGGLPDFGKPSVSLLGELDQQSAQKILEQLAGIVEGENAPAVVEITTPGGDAELGRRLILEIELTRKRSRRRLIFLGKTEVYSVGVTLMSAFPREDRYLSPDAVLLIHSRQLDKTVELSGSLRANLPRLRAMIEQVETGITLEEDNFKRLIEGSDVPLDELLQKAPHNWYLTAEEAAGRGLIAAVVPADRLIGTSGA